jgi:CDP-glucose 4,6-dehydratase
MEMVVACYREAYLRAQGTALASARAGNVIGGGDWAEDRLIPDAVLAWQSGRPLCLRHPEAVRPWQHVLDALRGYLLLAEKLWDSPELAGAYNFGPEPAESTSVGQLAEQARDALGQGQIIHLKTNHGPQENPWLALSSNKARDTLGVTPRWPLETAIQQTMRWYRRQHQGENAQTLCLADIATFEKTS